MIIEKFDAITKFVTLGYKGHILKEYLDLVYPNLNIEFVEIPICEGKNQVWNNITGMSIFVK